MSEHTISNDGQFTWLWASAAVTLVTLEVSIPGVDTVKESETSRQLTEDAITKLDSSHTIGDEQHALNNTQNNTHLTQVRILQK